MDSDRRFSRDFSQQFNRFIDLLAYRYDVVEQAQAISLLGVNHIAGHQQFQGFGFANVLDEALRSTITRDDTQVDLRLTEARFFARYTQVASHRQFATTAQGKAIDSCNDGLGEAFDEEKYIMSILRHLQSCLCIEAVKFGNIGSGHKGLFACTGKDHAFQALDL